MELNNAVSKMKNSLYEINNILDRTKKGTSEPETELNRNHPHQITQRGEQKD